MNQSRKFFLFVLSLGLILSVSKTVAQDTTTKSLIVNGNTVDAGVVQVQGRSYVDIEGLAKGIGGAVTFDGNQISLTIPTSSPSPAPETAEGMSKDFQKLAVFTLAEMREWRGAIGSVVSSGLPVAGTWSQDYHNRIDEDLMQAALAASADQDRQALQLLQHEFELLNDWANTVLGEREALNAARTIDPNSLQNDQSLAKITKCGRFLSSMIVSGAFSDDSSCN